MRKQKENVLGTLGDVNPIEHGGGFVFRPDADADSEPTIEYTHGPDGEEERAQGARDDDDSAVILTVYRCDVEADPLADLTWVDWQSVCRSRGLAESEIHDLAKGDPMQRAVLYELAAGHYGWHELDSYPLRLTVAELERRWFPEDAITEEQIAEAKEAIAHPGRYEGEPAWVAYLDSADLSADEEGEIPGERYAAIYRLTERECLAFPLLREHRDENGEVAILTRSDGFRVRAEPSAARHEFALFSAIESAYCPQCEEGADYVTDDASKRTVTFRCSNDCDHSWTVDLAEEG